MRNTRYRTAGLIIAILGGAAFCARADEVAEKGRAILEGHRSAVVTLAIVLNQKVSFTGASSRSNESKVEATGTVISPEGLTIMSLSETDPSSIMESMMAASGRGGEVQMETEIRDLKIMLEDGTEVAGEVILRDKDLDMAFVRPKEKPVTPFKYVNIEDAGKPDYLDQVITLNRLGQVAGREYAVSVERVQAIVKRPRTLYLPGMDPTQTGLGSPAFTLDGKFVGVFLLRVVTGGQTASSPFGGGSQNVATVIVPASDILEGSQQAPKFKE
jgi:hypothetical protein